jgi:IS1 family transposase
MNILDTDKRAQILHCLVEGCSMRSTQRLTGAAKKTVERLLVSAGQACAEYMDEHMHSLPCKVLQLDEIWSFVGCKQAHVDPLSKDIFEKGDCWCWIAIDAETKLIPAWFVGDRTLNAAYDFISDLRTRLVNRVQLTTDGYAPYLRSIGDYFGPEHCDYALLHKTFGKPQASEVRYSPPQCTGVHKVKMWGKPDPAHISTSFIERSNLTIRMSNRRFTRLTNAFSKKFENHAHSIAIHFMHYNYCRIHQTLRTTPAMAAGVSDHVWEIEDIVSLIK